MSTDAEKKKDDSESRVQDNKPGDAPPNADSQVPGNIISTKNNSAPWKVDTPHIGRGRPDEDITDALEDSR
jgi:hypothetical protein